MCERVFTQSRTRSFFFSCSFTSSLFILLVSLRLQPMSDLLVTMATQNDNVVASLSALSAWQHSQGLTDIFVSVANEASAF